MLVCILHTVYWNLLQTVHPLLLPAHTSNQFSEMDLTTRPVMACISVTCATKVLVTISIFWCTTGHTQENIHTYVTSVGSVSHSLVTLRLKLLYIWVNAHICVQTVARVSDKLHIYRNALLRTGQRPHVCTVCSKAFVCLTDLKNHTFIYTVDRPRLRVVYQDVCNTSSTAETSLHTQELSMMLVYLAQW